MALEQGLKNKFMAISKGSNYIEDIDQGAMLNYAKQLGVDRKDVGGVCWELCRRWIAAFLRGGYVTGETASYICTGIDPTSGGYGLDPKYMQELVNQHAKTRNNVDGNYDIKDMSRQESTERTRSCCQFTVLRTRADVLNHIYKNPGVYVYTFTDTGTSGHAVAFALTGERIVFFDPNFGEFTVDGSTKTERDKFLGWWKEFWGRYYKADFHKGERKLVRYTLN